MTEKQPRYCNHILKETIIIDSASFLFREGEADPIYCISDRYSPFVKGEEPEARLSLIKEGDRDFQLRIAIVGEYHLEVPRYFVTPPDQWREWLWIIIPKAELLKLLKFISHTRRRVENG